MTEDPLSEIQNTPSAPPKTDVVIVGAGPTGLMAAALLLRSGVSVRILDKSGDQVKESRAFGVHARSLELFLSIGLADEMLDRGIIATGVQVWVNGNRAAGLDFADAARADTPYPFILMTPQWDIEAILVDDLRRQGLEVEHGIEVTGFEQFADHVVVRGTDADGEATEIRAAYLIGADGAHSIVRKTLGLKFAGGPYPQAFLLADCVVDWPLDHDHLKLFLGKQTFALFLPLKGREVSRIVAVDNPLREGPAEASEALGSEPATLAEVEETFRAAAGVDLKLSDPAWVSRYRIHHRGVDRYRSGRVFVAGDAAHIHSPAGGQGMNTGLQDAANLAWKIALLLKRQAPVALLESYHAERWPVGQWVLNYTDRLFAFVNTESGWLAEVRNRVMPLAVGAMSRSAWLRGRAFRYVSQLGIHYEKNEFLRDDAKSGGLKAGRRAPNATIARNRDVFGLIDGYRFHVLALSQEPLSGDAIGKLSEELSSLGVAAHVVAHSLVGRDKRVIQAEADEIFQRYAPLGLFLIRPDGYVAYRSDRLDVPALKAFLREKFGIEKGENGAAAA